MTDLHDTGPPEGVETEQYVRSLVERWDELIDWDRRRESEGRFFVDILRQAGVARVLDAATGTGFHAVSLTESGFDVTAMDGSAEMVRRAKANARERGHDLPVAQADWRDLHHTVPGRYDAIVCLGSSFPHLFEEEDRRQTLEAFHAVLRPGGLLILDHRNFDAVRAHRYESSGRSYYCGAQVSVAASDEHRCRFRYAFDDGEVHHLEVYPVLTDELVSLLTEAGFDRVRTYGDFRPYDPEATPDFVIHVAQRQ